MQANIGNPTQWTRWLGGVLAAALLTALPGLASAERAQTFGDYVVHYNVITTDILDPEVARSYRILRSRQRAMINVAVLKADDSGAMTPVKAAVAVSASNLNAQLRQVEMRALFDQDAIYYIGEFPVSHLETLRFDVKVTPDGTSETYGLSFTDQFFTD